LFSFVPILLPPNPTLSFFTGESAGILSFYLLLFLLILLYYYYYYYYYYYCNRHTAPAPPQPSVRCAPICKNVGQHCCRMPTACPCRIANTCVAFPRLLNRCGQPQPQTRWNINQDVDQSNCGGFTTALVPAFLPPSASRTLDVGTCRFCCSACHPQLTADLSKTLHLLQSHRRDALKLSV
jgi:hypothetical protein